MKISINTRYALAFGVVSLVIIGVMAFSFIANVKKEGAELGRDIAENERRLYEENQGKTFSNLAQYLGRTLFIPLYQLDIEGINKLIGDMQGALPIVSFQVADGDGVVLTDGTKQNRSYGRKMPVDRRRLLRESVLSVSSGQNITTFFIISSGNHVAGYGEIVFSGEPLRNAVQTQNALVASTMRDVNDSLTQISIEIVAIVVIIAALLSVVFSRRLTQPLRELREATARVAAGDLSYRMRVASDDEIGEVAASFNRMVADLNKSTDDLCKANEKLRTLDQLKSDFLSHVSHELRTPITSIRAFVEIILMKRALPEERMRKMLGTVRLESERLSRLVNDLLDLSKIEAGKMTWKAAPLSLGDVVRTAAAAMQPLAEAKHITLTTEMTAGPNRIEGDYDRLVQVVTNLLSNAVKFTPPGGRIAVRVDETGQGGGAAIVRITDSGIGIAQDDLESIFEKFHRSEDHLTARTEGTGLGLPISRQIIEHHGGRIWAESVVNGGSSFTFTIPFAGVLRERTTPAR